MYVEIIASPNFFRQITFLVFLRRIMHIYVKSKCFSIVYVIANNINLYGSIIESLAILFSNPSISKCFLTLSSWGLGQTFL